MKKGFLLIMMICAFYIAHATDYYAAPGIAAGSGSGTSGDPWELLDALTKIPANQGHTLFLKTGTYTVSESINLPRGISLIGEGSDASLIVITADNDLGNDALLRLVGDNGGFPSDYGPAYDGNQEVSGFTIYGKDIITSGISVIARNNVKIKYMRVIDFDLSGIIFSGGPSNRDSTTTKISGSEIAYCYIENSAGVANRQHFYYSGNIEFGGWSGGSIHHNTIIDFAAVNEGGIGIKSRNGGYSWNTEVHHNFVICPPSAYRWGTQFTFEFNYPYGNFQLFNNIFQDGGTSLTRGPDGYRVIESMPNLIIRDNIFFKTHQPIELYTQYTEVYGNYLKDCEGSFAVAHTAEMKNMTFHHNILDNCNTGIHMKNSDAGVSENLRFYNNILKNVNSPFVASDGQSNNIDVQNNIFMDCGTIWSTSNGTTISNVNFDYNLMQNNTGQSSGTTPTFGSNNIEGVAPGLNFSGYPLTTYYYPASGSAAVVDAGNDLGDFTTGFQGSAPDIGRFEFGTADEAVTAISMPLEIAMYIDDVKRLFFFPEPWGATPANVSWSSSDNSVATVDQEGYVTAVANGEATIEADVDGHTATTLIRVVHVGVDSINITSSAVTLKKSESKTLSLLYYPRHATNQSVSWSSKDVSIATVSGGTITGQNSGETYIYAESNDNGFKDSVKVIVSTDKLPMAWWKFNNSGLNAIDDSWNAKLTYGTVYANESKEGSHSAELFGGSQRIEISHENIRIATSKRTIMFWVKFKSYSDTMVIYEEGGSKGGIALRMDPDKKLKYRVMDNYVYGDIIADYSYSTEWVHIAAVFEGNKIRLYFNGEEVGNETLPFNGIGGHTNPAGLGYRGDDDVFGENTTGEALSVDGYLDDVQIYDIALTEQEIKAYLNTDYIPVSGFDIVESDELMALNDTKKLTYTISPAEATNKNIDWNSDTPGIVSVDATGSIEALSLGNAMIVGTTSDGGYKDTVFVQVVSSIIEVTGVSINEGDTARLSIGGFVNLTEVVEPSNATNKKVTWQSSDESIATVDEFGLVFAQSNGTTTITVTTDEGGFTDEIVVVVGQETGINETYSTPIITYPNPLTGNKLSIRFSGNDFKSEVLIKLTDISGKTVVEKRHFLTPDEIQFDLILEKKIYPGMYILELLSKKESKYVKIIVE